MKGEVSDIDLLGLAICHVTCLPLYNFIKSNRGLLCYGRYSRDFAGLNEDEQRDEDRTQVENFISTLSAGQQGPPLATLSSLFPRVTWLTDGEKDGPRDKDLWLKELRICDPTRFNYYFSYAVDPAGVSQAELRSFVDGVANGKTGSLVLKYVDDARDLALFEELRLRPELIPTPSIEDFVRAIVEWETALVGRSLWIAPRQRIGLQ